MEAAPPTYEKATLVDYWDLIAWYIPSNDLCSTTLVSSRWHAIFVPHLWGNPASHFGIENDRVYVALTRFKRTLKTARFLVRSLTHTLHLPPAHAELYNGPNAEWLRDILERLPNLQSLIVRGLPFFDHSSLQALRYVKPKTDNYRPPSGVIELPASSGYAFEASRMSTSTSFGLRLLDASRCSNVTSHGLANALTRFENLLYLDLSFTYPARYANVMETLRRFSGLQVLKLRGVSLNDDGLGVLAEAIGKRVRSLDVRSNQITDRGVRTLLNNCFTLQDTPVSPQEPSVVRRPSPALLPYLGTEMLEIYQGEDFEGYLRSTFTSSFISRLAIEDAPEGGITHLYISGNALTAEGASGLLRSERLHVLDLGAVVSGVARHPSLQGQETSKSTMEMPGVEKLTPVLAKHAADSLTFLRIDHSLVTKDTPNLRPQEIVQGRVELADTGPSVTPPDAIELPATPARHEAFELPAVSTPKAELPGDPMQLIVSPAINDPQHRDDEESDTPSSLRRGSAFAPEVVDSLSATSDSINLLSPVSALDDGVATMTMNGFPAMTPPISRATSTASNGPTSGSARARPRSYSSLATERQARLNAHTLHNHNLHPAMLPHVQTLMLTDVPPFSTDREVIDRLTGFIGVCAQETLFARKQAKLDYALPPGRKGHASAIKHSADKIFALKRLVIELGSERSMRRNSKASLWQHLETKSMTEDRDSEALWSAAETDFSFFGDEECGLPTLEPGRFAHSFTNEKEVSVANGHVPPSNSVKAAPAVQPRVDTVALLSAFRKERKLAHQRNLAAGAIDPETEGFWEGVVQVVRPGGGLRHDEELDYYGNRFEQGWLYR